MNAEKWQRIHDLFGRALEIPTSDQEDFIEANVSDDPALGEELLQMLKSDRDRSFLDAGALPMADELFTDKVEDSFGPYCPKRSLGQGGMGVVYLAEHREWGTPVAIKVPRDTWISPDRTERFAAEQRLLAQLTHPGIARIYEGGTGPHGTPWFAMEYVEGEPITAFAQSGSLTVDQRLKLFRQVCEAVQYAHAQMIVHRDLKPSNMFVTKESLVKLLDFGIAKQVEEISISATGTGAQMLTLAYAAPEQVRDNHVSIHSDIYSLGVTLYELLTNRLPFDLNGLTLSQAYQIISTNLPDKPSAVSPLPLKRTEWADLDVLVLKALHKDVAQRYKSVDALIRDLDHFLNHEPLDARPDSGTYRIRKFIERRKLPVIFATSTLLLLVATVAWFTWHLTKARDEALAQAKRERQIQQFMTDLFEGGDSVNGPSKDMRVIDLLDAGVKKARQFDNDPLIQGDLYNTLGTVYQSVGDYEKASTLLQLARERFDAATGPKSREFAETLVYIGKLEADRGQYADAENTVRKALSIVQKLNPVDPVLAAFDETMLANILISGTHYAEALTVLKKAEQVQSKRPDTHQTWLDNLNLQATACVRLQRYDEAERLTQYLIKSDKQQHAVLRREDANDFVNLGQIQEARLHLSEAEETYRQALKIDVAWLPEGHPDLASTRRILALVLMKERKFDEATPLARKALSDLERTYGQSHKRVAYTFRLLGQLASARHDQQEARADFTQEIAIYRKIGDNADIPTALANLANLNVEQKDYRHAEALYEDAIQRFPATEWADGLAAAHSELMLGKIRVIEERYREAEAPLLSSLKLWPKQLGSHTDETRETLLNLVQTYKGLHQPDKVKDYSQQLALLEK